MTKELSPKEKRVIIESSFVLLGLIFIAILIGFAWVVSDVHDLSHDTADLSKNTASIAMNTASLTKENRNRIEDIADLTRENRNRIRDINVSRVEACGRIYNGIREVFRPFFPPPPRTREQTANLKKFNNQINRLKDACEDQAEGTQ